MAKKRIACIAISALLFLLAFAFFMRGPYFSAGTLRPDKTLDVTLFNFNITEVAVLPRDYLFEVDCLERSGRSRLLKPNSQIEWPSENNSIVVKPMSRMTFSVSFSAAESSQIGCRAVSVRHIWWTSGKR